MEAIFQYIDAHWVEWLFAAISAFLLFCYRKMTKQIEAEQKKNVAIQDGIQALLRDRIIQAYNHYQSKGFCPIYGKENVERMYDAYHALGGNDVATSLKETLMDMPEREGHHEREK